MANNISNSFSSYAFRLIDAVLNADTVCCIAHGWPIYRGLFDVIATKEVAVALWYEFRSGTWIKIVKNVFNVIGVHIIELYTLLLSSVNMTTVRLTRSILTRLMQIVNINKTWIMFSELTLNWLNLNQA